MRKKIAVLAFLAAVVAPSLCGSSASVMAGDELSRSGPCPKGSHLITCDTSSFCCPNNAFCECAPH
jgi:hypothetical protein